LHRLQAERLEIWQADGLQPRALVVLKSLGLAEEILTEGRQMWEVVLNPNNHVEPMAIQSQRIGP
jgi:phenol 2-monooxygenase